MQQSNLEELQINRKFKWLTVAIVVSVLLYAGFLVLVTWPITRISVEAAGTFGDSFGPLTSLFSGLAFAGLIWTILLQRVELTDTRRQSILTRLMTLTQNQVSAYRTELASIKFEDINKSGETYGLHEMLYAMTTHLESILGTDQKGEQDAEENLTKMGVYLATVIHSINSYRVVIDGLFRCCKSNRYLLTNEKISSEDAQDVKNLFLAELPTGLMVFVFQLHNALKIYEAVQKKANKGPLSLFDPIGDMQRHCSMILSHQDLEFTEESLAADRKQKFMFSPGPFRGRS